MADTQQAAPTTVTITVDGKEVPAKPGEMVIAAAERAGVYIPRFCYHDRLEPVGMCRMCLVNIDSGRGPLLQPACVIPVADGMAIDTQAPNVQKAQDGVLEFLLINHPLDCPVCDKGGECPLQDQTVSFGPGESRFVEEKRHFEKPIAISELVYLDRERCILCDRCTRFAKDIAGDPLISFTERGNQTQINTFPDDPFASYFSGNTVQLCPVGALTAQPYRFKARPWDLEQVESTCTTCSVGCRVEVQSSQNEVTRLLGIDVDPVNHGWLCDKGRFAYEAGRSAGRVAHPRVRRGEALVDASWVEALDAAAAGIRAAMDSGGAASVAVLGGARLTNEDAYAWSRFAKAIVGTDNVDCQLGDGLPAEIVLGLPRATINDACSADVTLVLGPDLKEELPVLHLRLRRAAIERRTTLIEVAPQGSALSAHAALSLRYRPGEAGLLARALVAGTAPADVAGVAAADIAQARALLGLGGDAKRVVVVLGRPSVAEGAGAVVEAAAALAAAVPGATFLPALRRGNVAGALDMGLAPGVLPGRVALDDGKSWFFDVWGSVPEATGLDATGILQAAAAGKIGALILLGADPLRDYPDRQLAAKALDAVPHVVAVDVFLTDSSARANVVLPAAAPHEREGTTTNLEGRVSRVQQKVASPGTARPDWMTAVELARRLGGALPFQSVDDIWAEIERASVVHAGITGEVLSSRQWRDGVPVPLPAQAVSIAVGEVDRAPGDDTGDLSDDAPEVAGPPPAAKPARPRPAELTFTAPAIAAEPPALDSYSLRLVAGRQLYDAGTLVQQSPALAGLTSGNRLRVNSYDAERLGLGTGATVRVASAHTTMELPLEVDDRVPRGSAALAFNQPGAGAADFIDATATVNDVRVETI